MASSFKIADGYSSNKLAAVLNTTPSGMEYALAVRLIGGATISGGGTSSLFTGAFPPSGMAAGFNDGADMQSAMVYDTDSSANTEWTLGVNLRRSGPSGSIEIGTLTNPVYIALPPSSAGLAPSHPIYVTDASGVATYQHIDTPNTTIVLSGVGGGTLNRVLITNFGDTGATTIIYDNTSASGTIIAKINTSGFVGELPFDITYDIGLTVVTDTKNPGDLTVVYT